MVIAGGAGIQPHPFVFSRIFWFFGFNEGAAVADRQRAARA